MPAANKRMYSKAFKETLSRFRPVCGPRPSIRAAYAPATLPADLQRLSFPLSPFPVSHQVKAADPRLSGFCSDVSTVSFPGQTTVPDCSRTSPFSLLWQWIASKMMGFIGARNALGKSKNNRPKHLTDHLDRSRRLRLKTIPLILISILMGPLGNVLLGKGMRGVTPQHASRLLNFLPIIHRALYSPWLWLG